MIDIEIMKKEMNKKGNCQINEKVKKKNNLENSYFFSLICLVKQENFLIISLIVLFSVMDKKIR